MSNRLKELQKENDVRNINAIVGEIHDEVNRSRKAVIRKVELLWYLERTNRFRELAEYKDSSFYLFIQHEFNLLSGTYQKERQAVLGFRDKCDQFGVGYVAKVIKGTREPEKLFKELNGMAKKAKRPLQREKLEELYIKHRKPMPAKIVEPRMCPQCEEHKQEIRQLKRDMAEKDEQISKLKAAIRKRDLALEQMNGLLRPFEHIQQAAVQ